MGQSQVAAPDRLPATFGQDAPDRLPAGFGGGAPDRMPSTRSFAGPLRGDPKLIAAAARRAGFKGEALATAIAVALAESGGNPRAANRTAPDDSHGLWQVNYFGNLAPERTRKFGNQQAQYDPDTNARAAYQISGGGKNWGPWTTYVSGKHQQYLDIARRAAAETEKTTQRAVTQGAPAKPLGRISDPGYRSPGKQEEIVPRVESPTLKAKRAAEVQNAKPRKALTTANLVSEINEATAQLGENIRSIPGVRAAENIAAAMPMNPARFIRPSDVIAGTVTGPLDVAADVARFLDTGEWQAAANVLTKSGAAFIPVAKGFQALRTAVASKNKAKIARALFDLSPEKKVELQKQMSAGEVAEQNYVNRHIDQRVKTGVNPKAAEAKLRTEFRNSGLREALDTRMGAKAQASEDLKTPTGASTGNVEANRFKTEAFNHETATVDDYIRDLKAGKASTDQHAQFYANNGPEVEAKLKNSPLVPPPPTKVEDAFGLATRFEQEGKPFSDVKHGKRLDDLASAGEQIAKSKPKIIEQAYERASKGEAVDPDHGAAVAYRGRQIKNRVDEVTKQLNDPEMDSVTRSTLAGELDSLDDEMGKILAVGNQLQKTFHQTGQTLRVAFQPDFSRATLTAKAKVFNNGEALDETTAAMFKGRIDSLETELTELKTVKAELEAQVQRMKAMRPAGGMRSADRVVRKKALVDGILNDLGMGGKKVAETGAKRSKQTGALNIPAGSYARLNAKATQLAKLYMDEGAAGLDDVIERMVKDVEFLDEADVLSLLSGKYRAKKLKADVHELEIGWQLRKIRHDAVQRQKPLWKRGIETAADAVEASQRAFQTGIDMSFPFIQGLPSAMVSPTNWAKSFGANVQPLLHGTKGANWEMAVLKSDKAYPYAVKGKVAFLDAHGPTALQEEIFRGNLVEWLRNVKIPVKAIRGLGIPGVTTWAELIGRSNEMFVAVANKVRMDLFKKFVAGRWSDPEALRDAGRLTNILTGRGDGALANALSHRAFAYVFYAPRYMYSVAQNAALPLLLPTFKTWKGRGAAMAAWSKQAGVIYGSLKVAEWFGAEVEDDWRSPNFGAITFKKGPLEGRQINLFRKVAEPARFFMQQIGGQFNAKGDYKEPSFYNNAYHAGKTGAGKAAPLARIGINSATGERFDFKEGQSHPFSLMNPEDLKIAGKELFTPLSIQSAQQMDGDISGIVAAFFGIDLKPPGKGFPKAPSIPFRQKG